MNKEELINHYLQKNKPLFNNKEKSRLKDVMSFRDIEKEIEKYEWRERIYLNSGIYTKKEHSKREYILQKQLNLIDFKNKTVLDIGCKNGFCCFKAEEKGAERIVGIDYQISDGTKKFLIDFFDSKVEFEETYIHDYVFCQPQESFDVVIYASRLNYEPNPFQVLEQSSNLIKRGGFMLIESAFYIEEKPIIYKPKKEEDVCGYKNLKNIFSKTALMNSMEDLGFECINICLDNNKDYGKVDRDSMLFQKK
jgi:2-polyprenyl-3-methyl-5-hydroxy-6-metoxy-1,4-benzoquinol methylase